MRTRSETYEELQFNSQIPSRLNFLRETSLFAEAFARTLPLVFGPLIIQQWSESYGSWAEAAFNWGGVCTAYSAGIVVGTAFGQYALRRRMRISQLHTPLLDSNLVKAARVVAEEAGASFLVFGLVGLALSILLVGFSRSVIILVIARAASGIFAGALVARWDLTLLGKRFSPYAEERVSRRAPEKPIACIQANSSTWLTGLTLGPLLGIFFHQRAFSRWKATLFLPSRVKALPEKTRHLLPALAPCIGGTIVLVALALIVMCETGLRWLRCDKQTCWRCRYSTSSGGGSNNASPSNSPRSSSNTQSFSQKCLDFLKTCIYWIVCLPCALFECLKGLIFGSGSGSSGGGGDGMGPLNSELSMLLETDDEEEDMFDGKPMRFHTATGSDDSEMEELHEFELDYSSPNRTRKFPSSPIVRSSSDYASNPKYPDFEKAFKNRSKEKFEAMLAWRKTNAIDNIMNVPHPQFFIFKQSYPFYIHGRTKQGELLTYENPGKMDLTTALKKGCNPEALRGILSCKYEYISLLERERQDRIGGNVDKQARMMTVVDVGGLSIGNLNKDTFAFMLTAGDIMDNYYPERVCRICIINAPFWFTGAWSGVSALLPKTITDKVQISGVGSSTKALLQFVDESELPFEYSGNERGLKLGQHPDELRLCSIVREVNKGESGGMSRSQSEGPKNNDIFDDTFKLDGGEEGGVGLPGPPDATFRRTFSSPELVGKSIPTLSRATSESSRATSTGSGAASTLVPKPIDTSGGSHHASGQTDTKKSPSWNPLNYLSRSNSKRAHLGDDNQFVYDRMKGEWVLSGGGFVVKSEDKVETGRIEKGGKRGSQGQRKNNWEVPVVKEERVEELLEQHAITLAIQAAHLANEWQSRGALSLEQSMCASINDLGGSTEDTASELESTPRRLILLLTVLHASWCCIHVGLETVVPLWMFSPPARGGLGFEPVDAALVFGFVGCVLLMLKSFVPARLSSLAQHAPLRALRLGVGILVVLCFSVTWVPAAELHKPRNESVVVWLLVTTLLSGLAAAVILGRSSTAVMLQVALDSNHVRPHALKKKVTKTVELLESLSPIINGSLFAWAFALRTPYPMDATFCFNLMSVIGIGLYTISLVLHINIVGDFGSAPEGATINERAILSHWLCGRFLVNRGYPGANALVGGLGCLEEILVVPASDISNLLGDVAHAQVPPRIMGYDSTIVASSNPTSSPGMSSLDNVGGGPVSRHLARSVTPPSRSREGKDV